jgi:hypothetical protein
MTRGEMEKITLAMYKIAMVEEAINNVEVWEAIGPNGMEQVDNLHQAISTLACVVLEDVNRSIELGRQIEGKA